jgi:hypothetical protein
MSVIVLKVVKSLGRWAVMHNDVPVASFDTQEEAERTALAIAKRHPARAAGQVDLPTESGGVSAIHIF